MDQHVALIGFGEAGRTFALAGDWCSSARAYDRLTDAATTASAKWGDYEAAGVTGSVTLAEALVDAPLILSLVTADQALAAAETAAGILGRGAIYCDMNSVAPDTKRAAARVVEAAGGRYVDVAVMAPVNPARLAVPLLLSGAVAAEAAQALGRLGFSRVDVLGGEVGRASAVKMIRSVMVKGMEALTAECVLAAEKAGVTDQVLGSLGGDWPQKADYNLDRMMVHGLRRAAEMEEVVKTLEGLGVEPLMTRGTVVRQRAIGGLGLVAPAPGLGAKIGQINRKEA